MFDKYNIKEKRTFGNIFFKLLNIILGVNQVVVFVLLLLRIVLDEYPNWLMMFFVMPLFILMMFMSGLFYILGPLSKWETWKNHYKRIDLEIRLGTLGTYIYVGIGLVMLSLAPFFIYLVYFKLKLHG